MSTNMANSQEAFITAVVKAIRLRLRAAIAAIASEDTSTYAERHEDEARLRRIADDCTESGMTMPLSWLRDRLHLSASEELVIWLLLSHEIDPTARELLRDLNTEAVADPTLDAIRRAAYGPGALARACVELAPDGRLRRMGLIHRTDTAERCPDHRQTFALARRILTLATGDVELDPALAGFASTPTAIPERERLVASPETVDRLVSAISDTSGLVTVSGRPGSGRRSLLLALATERGLEVLQVDCRRIASTRETATQQLRDLARECQLLKRVPLLCHLDALEAAGELPDRVEIVEAELSGLVLATANRLISRRWRRAPTLIEIPRSTADERAALWSRALPEASQGDADLLATMYPLAPALIIEAGQAAHRSCGVQPLRPAHISAGVRSVLDDRLAGLATRISVTQSWDDLVLPPDQETALIELLARIRQRSKVYETWGFGDKIGRGLGVAALFSGPPGTGKTMAAGLIAKDLGAELYQVDLSKIVSKWIGETERNLASLFDAAEAGHAILLFDEADSLFGKRTEVRSSNDRHANQEVNFLLQRIESFAGVCLMTTNHESSIDEAFRRRLSVHVRFPVPDVDERKHLWRALMPASAPVAPNVDLQSLAQTFAMSGGYIRNAMLRAAFLAADSGSHIDDDLLTRAAQCEYEAMGKIVASVSPR